MRGTLTILVFLVLIFLIFNFYIMRNIKYMYSSKNMKVIERITVPILEALINNGIQSLCNHSGSPGIDHRNDYLLFSNAIWNEYI